MPRGVKKRVRVKKVLSTKRARRLAASRKRNPAVRISHDGIRKAWDPHKSVAANFVALGLMAEPNIDLEGQHQKKARHGHGDGIKAPLRPPTAVVKELEASAQKKSSYIALCSRGEVIFVQECIEKHGFDYEAMSRDIKLNIYQHAPGQMKRLVEKYLATLFVIDKLPHDASLEQAEQAVEKGAGEAEEAEEAEMAEAATPMEV